MEISVVVLRERDPGIVSRGIMWWSGSPYSHIGICYVHEDRPQLFHATGEGVHVADYEEYMMDHEVVGSKYFKVNRDAFLGYVSGAVGKDYSELQYIGFIFPYKWLLKLVGDDDRGMICSELVADVLEKFSNISFKNRDLDFMSPKDVWEAI